MLWKVWCNNLASSSTTGCMCMSLKCNDMSTSTGRQGSWWCWRWCILSPLCLQSLLDCQLSNCTNCDNFVGIQIIWWVDSEELDNVCISHPCHIEQNILWAFRVINNWYKFTCSLVLLEERAWRCLPAMVWDTIMLHIDCTQNVLQNCYITLVTQI